MSGHPTVHLEEVADAVHAAPHAQIRRMLDRAHIETAILMALDEHDGIVTIAWVREHITRDVAPYMIGAVMSGFVKSHDLVWTGDYHPNGGPSGNAAKPARVWMRIKEPK